MTQGKTVSGLKGQAHQKSRIVGENKDRQRAL